MDDARWNAVLAHRDRLLPLALARGVSVEDAKDIVQEAMLRCVEFEALDVDRLGEFLTSVVTRLCMDVHRRNAEPLRAQRWLAPLLHHEPDPADAVCRDHGSEWVAGLMARLPERQRDVIYDRASGLSIQQIATRHRLTYKAAESALARARAALRSAVATSMSVAAFVCRRMRECEPALPATAAALVVTAALVTAPAPSVTYDGPAVRALPAAVDPVLGSSGSAGRPGSPGGSGPDHPHPTPTPNPGHGHAPSPSPTYQDPVPEFSLSASPVGGAGYQHEPVNPAERIEQCVRYGVETYPTLQCNRPPSGGPR